MTPEQARAELARRELARRELARRKTSLGSVSEADKDEIKKPPEVLPPERGIKEFGKGIIRGATSLIPSPQVTSLATQILPRFTGTSIFNPPVPSTETIKRGYEAITEKTKPITEWAEKRPITIGGQVAGGIGELIPTLIPMGKAVRSIEGLKALSGAGRLRALLRPMAGFAGYEAAKAGLQTEDMSQLPARVGLSALRGAGIGAIFGATGLPFKKLGRIGSIAGGATGMAITAPPGERISGGILGAGLGALGVGKKGEYTPEQKAKLVQDATATYRTVVRPTAGEVKNIEIRRGKNLDNYFKVMAEEGLPLERTKDKKLNTLKARETIDTKIEELEPQLTKSLTTSDVAFDLIDIYKKTAKELRNIDNAVERNTSLGDLRSYLEAEINRHGRYVDASTLNAIKRGMWKQGYNQLRPTSDKVARKIGFVAKEFIEDAIPDADIKGINNRIADLMTVKKLLENAQGRVVSGGQLGKNFARTIGAITGTQIPFAGPLVGAYLGGKVSEYLTSPERITGKIAKRLREDR